MADAIPSQDAGPLALAQCGRYVPALPDGRDWNIAGMLDQKKLSSQKQQQVRSANKAEFCPAFPKLLECPCLPADFVRRDVKTIRRRLAMAQELRAERIFTVPIRAKLERCEIKETLARC